MKITLIRHTSIAVEAGICYGQSDVEVRETFETEASAVLDKISQFSFDAVFSSPLFRCVLLTGFCGFMEAIADPRLMEMNFGNWELQKWESIKDPQLQKWYDNWVDEVPTNGESFSQMIERVQSFVDDLKKQKYRHVAVFTHAGVIRTFLIIINQLHIEEAFDFSINYGEKVEVEI